MTQLKLVLSLPDVDLNGNFMRQVENAAKTVVANAARVQGRPQLLVHKIEELDGPRLEFVLALDAADCNAALITATRAAIRVVTQDALNSKNICGPARLKVFTEDDAGFNEGPYLAAVLNNMGAYLAEHSTRVDELVVKATSHKIKLRSYMTIQLAECSAALARGLVGALPGATQVQCSEISARFVAEMIQGNLFSEISLLMWTTQGTAEAKLIEHLNYLK